MLNSFTQNISPRGKLLISVLLIICISFPLIYWITGSLFTILFSFLFCFILFITKSVWLSDDHGKNLLRRMSLGIVVLLSGSYGFWNTYTSVFINNILRKFFPDFTLPPNGPSVFILIFVLIGIFIVNYYMRDKTAMNLHSIPIDKDFPELGFKKRLLRTAELLEFEMRRIDNETLWCDDDFTPLEAEVEIFSNNKKKKSIIDLLGAIRKNKKSKTFLILGEPGSGKSVALRQLTKQLLREVENTGKLPVYINLKEWQAEKKWDSTNLPKGDEFYNFILNSLKQIPNKTISSFINDYFDKMYAHGRFFFVLDSFDEIPEIMDTDESSWLIDKLSHLIFSFLNSANDSRGVLASRIFRKPTSSFQTDTVLEIRPFSELKIQQAFKNQLKIYDESIMNQFFRERKDLVSVAKNPFTAALLIRFIEDNNSTFPNTKSEMYSSYIDRSLSGYEEVLKRKKISSNLVKEFCVDFSFQVYQYPSLGLEMTMDEIKTSLTKYSPEQIEDIVDILVNARLCRKSNEKRISFVHRRFNEYFVVNLLLISPEIINIENIATDSRWRDSMVLYCEISSTIMVENIVNFCWKEIKLLNNEGIFGNTNQLVRSIHCLRFLTDAFIVKKDSIQGIESEVFDLIKNKIQDGKNLLLVKFCVEATGILSDKKLTECLLLAFDMNNEWISEVSFKASRNLSKVHKELEKDVTNHITQLSITETFKRRKEILFSLSLSDAFSSCRRFFIFYIWDLFIVHLAILGFLFMNNPVTSIIAFILILIIWGDKVLEYFQGLKGLGYNIWLLLSKTRITLVICTILFYISFLFDKKYNFSYHIMDHVHSMLAPFIEKKSPVLHVVKNNNVISIKDIIYFVSAIFILFPWIDIFILKRKIYFLSHSFRKLIKLTWAAFLGIAIFLILFIYFPSIIMFLSIAIFLFIFCIFLKDDIIPSIKDRSSLNQISKKISNIDSLNRADLITYLEKLKTDIGKRKFLNLIDTYSIKAKGQWPDGVFPKFASKDVEIALYKLEEKWLGLN